MIEEEHFDLDVQLHVQTRSFALAAELRAQGASVVSEAGGLLSLCWTSPDPTRLLELHRRRSEALVAVHLELRLITYYDQFGWEVPGPWRALFIELAGAITLEISAQLD